MTTVTESLEGIIRERLQTALPGGSGRMALDSRYGVIATDGEVPSLELSGEWKSALRGEAPSGEADQAWGIRKTADGWDLAGCFTVGDRVFYPRLRWRGEESPSIRTDLLAALDGLTRRCREILQGFYAPLTPDVGDDLGAGARLQAEAEVIRGAAHLSARIQCIALLDDDGFVLACHGSEETAESMGHRIAEYRRWLIRRLGSLPAAVLRGLVFENDRGQVRISRLPGTGRTLILAIDGAGSRAIAGMAFHGVLQALSRLAPPEGAETGSPSRDRWAGRYRDSWFGDTRLVLQGALTARKGSPVFHRPICRRLARTEARRLVWFDTRADAIRQGLRPCRSCRA